MAFRSADDIDCRTRLAAFPDDSDSDRPALRSTRTYLSRPRSPGLGRIVRAVRWQPDAARKKAASGIDKRMDGCAAADAACVTEPFDAHTWPPLPDSVSTFARHVDTPGTAFSSDAAVVQLAAGAGRAHRGCSHGRKVGTTSSQ